MASPSYAAERLKALRQKITDESDKLVSAVDTVENKDMPEAFAHGHAFLKAQQADVQALKDELAQLSNLGPLDPGPATASSDSKPTQ